MDPITRQEIFLAAASGENIDMPEPITREEMYLKKIAEKGGGDTSDYVELSNKPQINDVELNGNKSSSDLGIVDWQNNDIVGAKNRLNLSLLNLRKNNSSGTWNGNVCSFYGVEITVNIDNEGNVTSLKLNGESTANAAIYFILSKKKYTENASLKTYGGQDSDGTIRLALGVESDADFYMDYTTSNTTTSLYIAPNKDFDNLYVYPMICLASDSDSTYQPYAMSNVELTPTEVDIPITDSNNTASKIYLFKQGMMLVARIHNSSQLTFGTAWADVTGFTLPEGFRPSTVGTVILGINCVGGRSLYLRILSTGAVSICADNNAAMWAQGCGVGIL